MSQRISGPFASHSHIVTFTNVRNSEIETNQRSAINYNSPEIVDQHTSGHTKSRIQCRRSARSARSNTDVVNPYRESSFAQFRSENIHILPTWTESSTHKRHHEQRQTKIWNRDETFERDLFCGTEEVMAQKQSLTLDHSWSIAGRSID